MSASDVKPKPQLEVGDVVKIRGLKAAAEHNGCFGNLTEWNEEKGRWGVKLLANGMNLGVKPDNLVFIRKPTAADLAEDEDELGQEMERKKARFDRITKKYDLFGNAEKAGEIADLLTGAAEDRDTIGPKEFAERYGMEEKEAEDFLSWIQVGVKFKESAMDPHSNNSEALANDLNKTL